MYIGITLLILIILVISLGFLNSKKPTESYLEAQEENKTVWDKIYCTFNKCDGTSAGTASVLAVFKEMKTDIASVKNALPTYITKNTMNEKLSTQEVQAGEISTNTLTVNEDTLFKDDIVLSKDSGVFIEGGDGPLIENTNLYSTPTTNRHGIRLDNEFLAPVGVSGMAKPLSKRIMRMYTGGDLGEANLAWSFIDGNNQYDDVLVAKKNGNDVSLNLNEGDFVINSGRLCLGNSCIDSRQLSRLITNL